MRERDDDAPVTEPEGSLADGVGETAEPGGYESTSDPYGDTDFGDDSYGDSSDDETSVDDTSVDDTSVDDDDSYGDDDTYGTDSTYGDGDDGGDVIVDSDTDGSSTDVDETVTEDESPFADGDLAEDNSPLEGIGFLLDEVREALFGDDDAAAASPFDTDPVDLETETDLDLTGDGVVNRADLHEAASSFDFGVAGQHHHGHHDDGVMDA